MRPAPRTLAARRPAFTLLELCIAIFIAAMIMMAALPSINGVIREQRAKKLFNQFDDLAKDAGNHAVTERRPYILFWDDSGVAMRPASLSGSDSGNGAARVDFGEKMAPDLYLPATLQKLPPRIWTFWPTGTCEPAKVTCKKEDAPWTARYDALTEQPYFTSP